MRIVRLPSCFDFQPKEKDARGSHERSGQGDGPSGKGASRQADYSECDGREWPHDQASFELF
jgi:hypothetical protein